MITSTVQNLGGGVNGFNGTDAIGSSEIQSTSRNVRGEAESCKPRRGYTTFADLIAGTAGIAAFGAYTRFAEADDVLVMVNALKLYKINPTSSNTWTEIATSRISDSANMYITSHGDNLYLFNGVNKPIKIAGTSDSQPFTNPTTVTSDNFLPTFGETHLEHFFVAGVPTAPNVLFISKAASTAHPEYIYDFSGTLTNYGDSGEITFKHRVTAFRSLDSAAVVFTTNETWYIPGQTIFGSTVVWDRKPVTGASGAVSQKATCIVADNDIFYLTPQKEIKSVRRSQANQESFAPSSMSVKIQKFLTENMDDDLSTAFSVYDPVNKLYKLYFKPTGGVMNLMRVVADLNKIDQNGVPTWYIDDAMPFRCGIFYKGQAFLGSTVLGQAYKDENGLADDDNSNIVTVRVGRDEVFNNPSTLKTFRRVRIFGSITSVTIITANVYVDGVLVATRTINAEDLNANPIGGIGTAPIGEFAIGVEEEDGFEDNTFYNFTKDIGFRAKGKNIRVDLVTDGVNNDYRINFFEYSFIPRQPLLNPLKDK